MIRFEDGVPVSTRFGDTYYARGDGLAETRHVFLDGNGFGARAIEQVGELGFGTGLNLAALLASGFQGRFTSFEAFPMEWVDARKSLAAWPELNSTSDLLSTIWTDLMSGHTRWVNGCQVTVVVGDARDTLEHWQGPADAWFLDGFSPSTNPEMWSPALMQQVHDRTRSGGTFATYTAAGHVRRSLADAGFEVERVPGHGRKRHMTIGRRPA